MPSYSIEDDQYDPFEELDYQPAIRNMPRAKKSGKAHKPGKQPPVAENVLAQIAAENEETFHFSYQAGDLEAEWLYDSLGHFYEQKWIDDILRVVKGGKEASVYLCQGNDTTGADLLAAKVYRPRKFRQLRNDALYREGRGDLDENGNQITNKGQLHAIRKRTEYGRELLHTSWLEHEFQTMRLLEEAGADLPKPYTSGNNAIIMAYYGDEVIGAPTLNDVDLDRHEAVELYERVIYNIELMLSHDRIHGDLSAFNILYWEGEIALIDFPQAIDPNINSSSFKIFERDVVRVCEYFQRRGVRTNGPKLAAEMWESHHLRKVPLIDPKMLGEEQEDERGVWESLKNRSYR